MNKLLCTVGFAGLLGFCFVVSAPQAHAGALSAHDSVLVGKAGADHSKIIKVASDTVGKGAESFVNSMANRAIGFLGNASMSEQQKKSSFQKLLRDSFDMKTIGRFSLGRYWRVSTPEQRNEYQKLFEQMVVDVYSSRFSEYKGQKLETRGFREEGEKDTLVTSFVVPDQGPEIQVDWRVRHKNGKYMIVDVIVEGVSMSVTQRSDFSSVIQRGGGSVQVLIDHLRSL